MIAPVVFPDVELHFTGYLRARLAERAEAFAAGVKVDRLAPAVLPARLVTVRRDGGGQLSAVLDNPRLTVNVWHDSHQGVADLARLVSALMWAAPNGGPVCRVDVNSGPSRVPEENGKPHVVMTFDAIVRGEDI